MRNIDDLVRNNDYPYPKTFSGQKELYNERTQQIEKLLEEKQLYDELISEDNLSEEAKSFKNALSLYNLAMSPNQKNHNLVVFLFMQNPELKTYIELCRELREKRQKRSNVLSENISFNYFADDLVFDEICFPRHYLVKTDDNLVCMCCGAKTQDFGMTKEDVEFLELCAENQGMFLKEVSKKDVPLLMVLLEERRERVKERTPIHEIEEDSIMGHMDWAEEYYLEDEAVISDMRRKIKQAQMLDEGLFEADGYRVSNSKYLEQDRTEKLLTKLNKQIASLENSTTKSKELQLEMCRTVKYEVLILAGNRVPVLYEEAKNEDEKIALIKAYYNISNTDYRINSGYFKPDHRDNDAIFYTCRTAHPEINQKLLEMKLKR